jgi:hypothetical protein
LDWLQNVELRRRVNAGLNKSEARNALARAVFFNRLGEMRDRSFENQRYRTNGLNLVTAAIVLWNTVYLEHAVQSFKNNNLAYRQKSIAIPTTPRMGTHQSDGGLLLAGNSQDQTRKIQTFKPQFGIR